MQRKKRFYRILALALILIFTFSLFGGCGQPDAPTPTPAPDPDDPEADEIRFDRNIKVGIIDTYTGPPTVYTYDARDGFEMAVNEINDAGGIYGAELEFKIEHTLSSFKSFRSGKFRWQRLKIGVTHKS